MRTPLKSEIRRLVAGLTAGSGITASMELPLRLKVEKESLGMKYRVLFLIVLMLVHFSCSPKRSDQSRQQAAHQTENGSTISLGMSHQLALEIIRECGGQDITSKLAVVGPHGEWPMNGLFWSLDQYNSVLEIAAEDGNVIGISYWTVADFSESKSHRFESRKSLKSLTFEKQAKTLNVQVL